MDFIDYYPFLDRVLTYLDAMIITEKEYQILKNISNEIRKETEENFNNSINHNKIIIYHIEKSIRESKLNNNSILAKEIIIANILLPNDIDIIDLLNKSGYTYDSLKNIIRFRTLIKNIVLSDKEFNNEERKKYKEYKEEVKNIIYIFKENYNITDQTIILNRICELLIRKPNSFENKLERKSKKR